MKAPVLAVWGLDEMCVALDVLCHRNELTENRETNNSNKRNLEIWQKKFGAQNPQEREHLCTKPLTDAFFKVNPFRQRQAAISLKDIKAAVARTWRIFELSVKGWTFIMLYLVFLFTVYFDTKFLAAEGN